MTTTKKASETGWFYHAPARPRPDAEPVGVPPCSQIPGLSELPPQGPDEMSRKLWIRDTDSDYIRLAKQGGRADLLRFRSPKPKSEGPVGYPRCDWYYHDDVFEAENQEKNNDPAEFLLPDYMVHQEWNSPESNQSRGSKRAPFAYDQDQVYNRDGPNPTDKTVKLPELRAPGYGIRNEKQQTKNSKYAPINRAQPIRRGSELDEGKHKYQPMTHQKNDQPLVMGKLLSHGYIEDWNDERSKWYSKQKAADKRDAQRTPQQKDEFQSEYQQQMSVSGVSSAKPSSIAGVATRRTDQGKSHKKGGHQPSDSEKELFKLSNFIYGSDTDYKQFVLPPRFKNVQAKTESHRLKNRMQHGHNPIVHDLEPIGSRIGSHQHEFTPVAS